MKMFLEIIYAKQQKKLEIKFDEKKCNWIHIINQKLLTHFIKLIMIR